MMQTFWVVGSRPEEMEKFGYPGLLPDYPVSNSQRGEEGRQYSLPQQYSNIGIHGQLAASNTISMSKNLQ